MSPYVSLPPLLPFLFCFVFAELKILRMASGQPERASLCDIQLPHSHRGVWKQIPSELLWNGNPLSFTSGQGLWWRFSHLDSEYLVRKGLLSSTLKSEETVKEGNFN